MGFPRADVFYPGKATAELTKGPMYHVPSVVDNQGFLSDLGTGGQQHISGSLTEWLHAVSHTGNPSTWEEEVGGLSQA